MRKIRLTVPFFLLLVLIACNSSKLTYKRDLERRTATVSSEYPDVRNYNTKNMKALKELYKRYKDGEIRECIYKGQTVYCAGINAYDAGSYVYDREGNEIGRCNYAWKNVDSICEQLTDCEVIYRVKGNIWGLPAVDKYQLGKRVR